MNFQQKKSPKKGERITSLLIAIQDFLVSGVSGHVGFRCQCSGLAIPCMKLDLLKFLFRSNWVLAPSGGADT
jgi:hypothetical protein